MRVLEDHELDRVSGGTLAFQYESQWFSAYTSSSVFKDGLLVSYNWEYLYVFSDRTQFGSSVTTNKTVIYNSYSYLAP